VSGVTTPTGEYIIEQIALIFYKFCKNITHTPLFCKITLTFLILFWMWHISPLRLTTLDLCQNKTKSVRILF